MKGVIVVAGLAIYIWFVDAVARFLSLNDRFEDENGQD